MRVVIAEPPKTCHGLHIRYTGLFLYGNRGRRPMLFKRFADGWAFCFLGFHIFYAKRERHGIMIHGAPPERRRPLHVRRVHR